MLSMKSDNKYHIDEDAFIFSFESMDYKKVLPKSKVIGCFENSIINFKSAFDVKDNCNKNFNSSFAESEEE